MKATFDNITDYLAELRKVAADRETNRLSIVRGTVSKRAVNPTVKEYAVVSGFHDNQYVYEAVIDCGQDHKGGAEAPTPACDLATHTITMIELACAELKVEFRYGKWEME